MRILITFLLLLLLSPRIFAANVDPREIVLADYYKYNEYDRTYIRYFSFEHISSPDQAEDFAAVLKFVVPSCSTLPLLDKQIPQRVHPQHSIYKIDLRDLGWHTSDFSDAVHGYPYHNKPNPLIIRGDWFVYRVTETKSNQAYYRLLYGSSKNIPETSGQFLKHFSVDVERQKLQKLEFGVIVEDSGVALARERWIEHYEKDGGYVWGTKDSIRITPSSSPIANPTGNFTHDGEEWIVGIPKIATNPPVRGTLQGYLLANGQSKRIEEGGVDLVEDKSRFKGVSSVRTWGSCVQCHIEGINGPTSNAIKSIVLEGVEIYKDKDAQEYIDRFHLGEVGKEIRRNQEDYVDIIFACNGLSPEKNVANFKALATFYGKTMTFEQVAGELYTSPEVLQNALAYASQLEADKKLPFSLGTHLARLAHKGPLERSLFEEYYYNLQEVIRIWNTVGN